MKNKNNNLKKINYLFKNNLFYITIKIMEHLEKILSLFTQSYSQFKDVKITQIPFNNLYIARCNADKDGDYYIIKKNRLINVIPTEIILTDKAMKLSIDKLTFVFIHECSHGITPHVERKVKNKYVRIDHSRLFYNNFYILLKLAYTNNLSTYLPKNIKELMNKDNRKENIQNDYKIYKNIE